MVNRIKITRDAIKMVSNNEVDILNSEEFKELKELIEKF
jgi:hypothetical protein